MMVRMISRTKDSERPAQGRPNQRADIRPPTCTILPSSTNFPSTTALTMAMPQGMNSVVNQLPASASIVAPPRRSRPGGDQRWDALLHSSSTPTSRRVPKRAAIIGCIIRKTLAPMQPCFCPGPRNIRCGSTVAIGNRLERTSAFPRGCALQRGRSGFHPKRSLDEVVGMIPTGEDRHSRGRGNPCSVPKPQRPAWPRGH